MLPGLKKCASPDMHLGFRVFDDHTRESLFFLSWPVRGTPLSYTYRSFQPAWLLKEGFHGRQLSVTLPAWRFPPPSSCEHERHLVALSGGSLKQYSFPVQVQGRYTHSLHGYMTCDLNQRARRGVIYSALLLHCPTWTWC